jgi:putative FmdB family regulatory protein
MPLYEYVCQSCLKRTEVIQKVGARQLKICPHCGGELKKAFSAPAIQFKGSGWYVTDYAGRKSGESGAGEAKSEKTESGGSGETAGAAEKKDAGEKKKEAGPKKTRSKE